MSTEFAAEQSPVTFAWRGRDIGLLLPAELVRLDDEAALGALFGAERVAGALTMLARDRRGAFFRLRPCDFARVKAAVLAHGGYSVAVDFAEVPLLPESLSPTITSRPYQDEALLAWRAAGYRGVVVLPTGAGKTIIGALAIADLEMWSLVIVPTIELLGQWRAALGSALGCSEELIGVYGGGAHETRPITVTTYESAQRRPELLRPFGLVIFDECHHLPAPTYRQIADGTVAAHRLGLSATPERADLEHLALEQLIGPVIYRREPRELAARHYLADYEERLIPITLDDAERDRYEAARASYREYLRRRRISIASPADFQRKVLWASARDPEARAAMLAWREARSLSLNAPAKLATLETLFACHRDERVLVFSEYNSLVDDVSRRFCIPAITHKTPAEERRAILERFRAGAYSKLVTGRVLNEGVDIPDCGVAVILSGAATRREYIQRLGRILRPKASRAILYELVTEQTTEERVSDRRKEEQ